MKTRSRIHENQRGDSHLAHWPRRTAQTNRNPAVTQQQSAPRGMKSRSPFYSRVPQMALATPPKHLLVPIDFSTESTAALRFAVDLASRYAADIALVHVAEGIHYVHDFGYGPVHRHRPNEGLVRHARHRLHDLRRRHVGNRLACKVMIKSGSAFEKIVEAAEDLDADLIVMPTRGTTHHESGEIGSTAERVVRHAPCPVLTLRKPLLLKKRS